MDSSPVGKRNKQKRHKAIFAYLIPRPMINPNLLDAYKGEYYPYGHSVLCGNFLINHGTGIPLHEVEALARILLPQIQAFFESEEGQKEFAKWKEKQKDKD